MTIDAVDYEIITHYFYHWGHIKLGEVTRSDCLICKEIEAMKIMPVLNMPVVYVPRESEPCYCGPGNPVAGIVVHVNDGGTVNVVIFDRNGQSAGRPNVKFVQFGADAPLEGEYCLVDPAYLGDHRTLNALCDRVNQMSNTLASIAGSLLSKTEKVPYDGGSISVADPSASAGLGHDVVPPLSNQEIQQELDAEQAKPLTASEADDETDEVKEDHSADL